MPLKPAAVAAPVSGPGAQGDIGVGAVLGALFERAALTAVVPEASPRRQAEVGPAFMTVARYSVSSP